MGDPRCRLSQVFEQRLEQRTFPKPDLVKQQFGWRKRHHALGYYSPGPTSWTERLNTARKEGPEAVKALFQEFEEEEQKLTECIIGTARKLSPPKGFQKVMVMACGTRRVRDYLPLLEPGYGCVRGVDFLEQQVETAKNILTGANEAEFWPGTGVERWCIYEGIATDPTEETDAGTFDFEDWSRIGNHLLLPGELEFALEQVVLRLKVGGWLLVTESFTGQYNGREQNPGRKMSPGSQFKTVDCYVKALGPRMQLAENLVVETVFAGDDYLVVPFRKLPE